jgi:signal peptidase I
MSQQTDPSDPTPLAVSEGIVPVRSRGMAVSVWLRDLLISLAISGFIIIFVYQPVKVEGTSMMPSLEDQERIFVNKFVYRLEPIERGDIVVFRYPMQQLPSPNWLPVSCCKEFKSTFGSL